MQSLSNVSRNIRRKKGIHLDCTKSEMKRCIGTSTLSALAIGNMVGCGVYVVTGEVVRNIAGPSAVLSYIIAGILVFVISLCFSEFAIRFPKAGSVYYYSYVAFGEICAFITGWNATFEKTVSVAAIAKAQSNFINYMTNSLIKNVTIKYILNGQAWDHSVITDYPDFLASLIIIVVCILLALGTQISARLNNLLVVTNISVIAIMLCTSVFYADYSRWSAKAGFFPYGAEGVLVGAATCFWVYTGFDDISCFSEEIINPAKSIPIATFVGIFATGVTNSVVALVITAVQPYQEIDANSMLTSVFTSHGNTWMTVVIGIGVTATVASIIVTHASVARIIQNMAADRLLFKSLAHIDQRTGVPSRSTIFLGLVCAVMAMIFDVAKLVEFGVLGALSSYIMTSVGVLILRHRNSESDFGGTKSYNNNTEPSLLFKGMRKNYTSGPQQNYNFYKPKHYSKFLVDRYSTESVATWSVVLIVILLTAVCVVVIHFFNLLIEPNCYMVVFLGGMCFAIILVLTVLAQCKEVNIPNEYKVPMTPYFPLLAVTINIVFILLLKPVTWLFFLCWDGLGLLVYIFYGYRNSIEGLVKSRDERDPLLNKNTGSSMSSGPNTSVCCSLYESTI
ncbi:cationic amino acid transporter 4-like [Anneissia japonica]|uniref:cationic amino acid transporter 4-like n=1 Tax=Anneissia japonica TaxID=1529436 RepID=UPI0014256DC6|nr:cationic amino acid transporter 4-like [Anneissia japonica]